MYNFDIMFEISIVMTTRDYIHTNIEDNTYALNAIHQQCKPSQLPAKAGKKHLESNQAGQTRPAARKLESITETSSHEHKQRSKGARQQ